MLSFREMRKITNLFGLEEVLFLKIKMEEKLDNLLKKEKDANRLVTAGKSYLIRAILGLGDNIEKLDLASLPQNSVVSFWGR